MKLIDSFHLLQKLIIFITSWYTSVDFCFLIIQYGLLLLTGYENYFLTILRSSKLHFLFYESCYFFIASVSGGEFSKFYLILYNLMFSAHQVHLSFTH